MCILLHRASRWVLAPSILDGAVTSHLTPSPRPSLGSKKASARRVPTQGGRVHARGLCGVRDAALRVWGGGVGGVPLRSGIGRGSRRCKKHSLVSSMRGEVIRSVSRVKPGWIALALRLFAALSLFSSSRPRESSVLHYLRATRSSRGRLTPSPPSSTSDSRPHP